MIPLRAKITTTWQRPATGIASPPAPPISVLMVPGARLCENGRFYRDGARAPHTSASNIDIGGAGVAISTQFGLWSLFSHATDPSFVVGMDIRGAGGSRCPSLASAKWSLFSHAMEWNSYEPHLRLNVRRSEAQPRQFIGSVCERRNVAIFAIFVARRRVSPPGRRPEHWLFLGRFVRRTAAN